MATISTFFASRACWISAARRRSSSALIRSSSAALSACGRQRMLTALQSGPFLLARCGNSTCNCCTRVLCLTRRMGHAAAALATQVSNEYTRARARANTRGRTGTHAHAEANSLLLSLPHALKRAMHSSAAPSLAVGRLSHAHLQGDTYARSQERAHIHERGCKREHTSTNETSVRHARAHARTHAPNLAHTHGHARKQAPTHAQRIDHGCPWPWPTLCAWGVAGDSDRVGLAACGADRLARGITLDANFSDFHWIWRFDGGLQFGSVYRTFFFFFFGLRFQESSLGGGV